MSLVKQRLVTLVILMALACAAGAALWWSERSDKTQSDARAKDEKVLRVAAAADIQGVRLTNAQGTFSLERAEGGWLLREPLATQAEATLVDAMATHLAELKRTAKVGEGQKLDLALFGLSPARTTVELTTKEGVKETLLVGKRNDFNGDMYVKLEGSEGVVMVPGAIDYQVQKSLFDLREKRLVVFEAKDVRRLVVSFADAKKVPYTVEKSGERYLLTSPLATPADFAQVNGILLALGGVRAKSFVAEAATGTDLAKYRLGRPEVVAEVELVSGTKVKLGFARGEGEQFYAARLDAPGPLLEVSGDWTLRKLDVEPTSLRDLTVAVFEREAVRRIELERGDDAVTLARVTKDDRESWTMVAPESAGADEAKVSSLLYKLFTLKAQRVVKDGASAADLATAGLSSPSLTVRLLGKDDKELLSLHFGKDQGSQRFATNVGSGRIDVVDKADVDDLSAKPADYKEQPAAPKG